MNSLDCIAEAAAILERQPIPDSAASSAADNQPHHIALTLAQRQQQHDVLLGAFGWPGNAAFHQMIHAKVSSRDIVETIHSRGGRFMVYCGYGWNPLSDPLEIVASHVKEVQSRPMQQQQPGPSMPQQQVPLAQPPFPQQQRMYQQHYYQRHAAAAPQHHSYPYTYPPAWQYQSSAAPKPFPIPRKPRAISTTTSTTTTASTISPTNSEETSNAPARRKKNLVLSRKQFTTTPHKAKKTSARAKRLETLQKICMEKQLASIQQKKQIENQRQQRPLSTGMTNIDGVNENVVKCVEIGSKRIGMKGSCSSVETDPFEAAIERVAADKDVGADENSNCSNIRRIKRESTTIQNAADAACSPKSKNAMTTRPRDKQTTSDGAATNSDETSIEIAPTAALNDHTCDLLNLPLGVTKRPSGKWQAQIFFVGQSRYLGVFPSQQAASVAIDMANRILTQARSTMANATTAEIQANPKAMAKADAIVAMAKAAAVQAANEFSKQEVASATKGF
ncbi:hypothetical protein MPSEU_000042200 [Mayamaea pseudoterrestris]|nr:hypothetical protein MPSEU_000042200 [Mayamaea pseudoterrestris]